MNRIEGYSRDSSVKSTQIRFVGILTIYISTIRTSLRQLTFLDNIMHLLIAVDTDAGNPLLLGISRSTLQSLILYVSVAIHIL